MVYQLNSFENQEIEEIVKGVGYNFFINHFVVYIENTTTVFDEVTLSVAFPKKKAAHILSIEVTAAASQVLALLAHIRYFAVRRTKKRGFI